MKTNLNYDEYRLTSLPVCELKNRTASKYGEQLFYVFEDQLNWSSVIGTQIFMSIRLLVKMRHLLHGQLFSWKNMSVLYVVFWIPFHFLNMTSSSQVNYGKDTSAISRRWKSISIKNQKQFSIFGRFIKSINNVIKDLLHNPKNIILTRWNSWLRAIITYSTEIDNIPLVLSMLKIYSEDFAKLTTDQEKNFSEFIKVLV